MNNWMLKNILALGQCLRYSYIVSLHIVINLILKICQEILQ